MRMCQTAPMRLMIRINGGWETSMPISALDTSHKTRKTCSWFSTRVVQKEGRPGVPSECECDDAKTPKQPLGFVALHHRHDASRDIDVSTKDGTHFQTTFYDSTRNQPHIPSMRFGLTMGFTSGMSTDRQALTGTRQPAITALCQPTYLNQLER